MAARATDFSSDFENSKMLENLRETSTLSLFRLYRVSVGITVDAPVTAVSNKNNDIQCFKDI